MQQIQPNLTMLPSPSTNYRWRPLTRNDISAVQQLTAVTAPIDKAEAAASEERIAHIFHILGENIATDTITAVTPNNSMAAIGFFLIPPTDDEHVAFIDTLVHPDHRQHPLEDQLLDWLENRIRQEFNNLTDPLPQIIQTSRPEHLTDCLQHLQNHGFAPVRYSYKMQRPLSHPLPEKPLRRGLKLATWSEDLDFPLMQAFNEAFSEHWGLPTMNESLWREFFTAVPQFRSDLTYLAMDGDTIVGFCLNWVDKDKNRQTGIQEGWVEAIGVIPAWRQQGVAQTLLVHSLNAFIEEGMTQAALDVDTQNPSGALQLYEKLGFTAVKRRVTLQKPLNKTR